MSKTKADKSFNILIGLLLGVVFAIIAQYSVPEDISSIFVSNISGPIGTLFLRSLFMVVVPLVAASLAAGVSDLGSVKNLGIYGKRAILFYASTTLLAVLIGQFYVNTLSPGKGVNKDYVEAAQAEFSEQTKSFRTKSEAVGKSLWPGIIEKIVPKNILEEWAATNMLSVIFVSILFGAALLAVPKENSGPLVASLHAISEASIIVVGWIMKLAPIAVFCLMFNAVLAFKAAILINVAKYFGVVVLGYLTHFFLSYGLITKFLIRMPLKDFYKSMLPIFSTAFSTSSSNATLPTTIRTLQENFQVPEHVVSFTAPLGATVNMDGTALFEVVAAVFIAQVFGIDLTLIQHLTLVALVVITSVGVAGVPGGSIPLLMSAMASVGIPPEGIALVLGVDRLLDMGRTVVNVTGDSLCAIYLSKIKIRGKK